MFKLEMVRHLKLQFSFPIVIVKKKDGANRICINNKKLNKFTFADPESMTRADDLFQQLKKSKILSKD